MVKVTVWCIAIAAICSFGLFFSLVLYIPMCATLYRGSSLTFSRLVIRASSLVLFFKSFCCIYIFFCLLLDGRYKDVLLCRRNRIENFLTAVLLLAVLVPSRSLSGIYWQMLLVGLRRRFFLP